MLVLHFRYKLLLLLLAAVAGAVIAVGLALDTQGRARFEQSTERQFTEARRALIGRLQALEQRAQVQAKGLAERLDVIATVNLVYAYQSKQRYQPLVFDGEKKALAQELGRQMLSGSHGTDQRVVTVYDAHGELVSFARAEGDSVQYGYISYENGKPVPYVSRPDTSSWSRLPSLPEACVDEGDGADLASGYGQCAGRFMLRAVAPIDRRFPSGASIQVGRVVLSQQIGTEMANQISEETGTRLSLYLHNRPLGGTLDVAVLDESLSRAAVPLLRDTRERPWVDSGRYFIQPHSIPLGSALNAYVLLGVDKGELNAQQQAIRDVVQRVLVVALALTIPTGLLFGWWFGRPARRYARHVAAMRAGQANERLPVSSDGVGRLADAAQAMASELHAQSALKQEFDAAGERIRWLEQGAQGLSGAIEVLAGAVEQRTPHLAGHHRRVAALAAAIAEELGLPANEVQGIRLGALLHDVGEVALPAELLNKSTAFTAAEVAAMRAHAKVGYDMLKELQSPWPIALMALQHHERLDGSGYPMGLKGEDIGLSARILAVADVAEAMVSARPHRQAHSLEQALAELERRRETLYDGRVVDACVALLRSGRFSL